MNFYFAPIISELQTRLTLNNYTPVEEGIPLEELYVYTTWIDGDKWCVKKLDKLGPGKSKTFTASDHPAIQSVGGMLLYFLFPDDLPDVLDTLPIRPDLLHTIPDWRANIQLCSPTTSVSYQGEYPDSMLGIPKGSLVSISPMGQTGEDVITKLIFTNIRKNPEVQARTVVIKGLQSNRIIAEFEVKTNHCNILDITDGLRLTDEPTGLLSPDMAGIPVYLSHDKEFRFLSLEHTHPPISLTMFGNTEQRMEMVRTMKQYWLKNVGMGK